MKTLTTDAEDIMIKKLTNDEAAKAMIDGSSCIGPNGRQYNWDKGSFWLKKNNNSWARVGNLPEGEWTIKKEPIKYSVDVWLSAEPKPEKENPCGILDYLFGDSDWTIDGPIPLCPHKYRVTVEEVGETHD